MPLAQPPRVAAVGVGVHGVRSAHDRFRLPELWQLHLYGYSADYAVDGSRMRIAPGSVSLAPPGSVVDYWYRGRSEHLYVHFAPGDGVDAGLRSIGLLQDAGVARPVLAELMRAAAVGRLRDSGSAEAAAHVWSALWLVAGLSAQAAVERRHPAVEAAVEYIEAHLADPLSVAAVARRSGVSHNHLTRLFAAQLGSTVVRYIRDRRMGRAHHLLTASTLPIATIAASVGIADLQAFNKACRRSLGAPPRAVREAAAAEVSGRIDAVG